MKHKRKLNQHAVYGIIIIVIVTNFLILGNYSLNNIKQDYTLQISDLGSELLNLQSEIESKQLQIDSLSSEFNDINSQLDGVNEQYEVQINKLTQQLSELNVESEGFSEIISEVIDSVVSIITNRGQGSGAIISSEGHIVTNYHVIEGARRVSALTYDGEVYGVELVGYNIEDDLAVLKIISNETFDYLEFADSDSLKAGNKIVALGNPAGLSFTATEGIISSPSREINGDTFIQTDVTVNPGNSGGPLINSQGEIIGIVEFKISGYEELGFAIPSNVVKGVVEENIQESYL